MNRRHNPIATLHSVIPVIAGMAVGIGLIGIMIIVGGSLSRYDTFYGDGGANVRFRDPGEPVTYPFVPGQVVPIEETDEDVDGCCDVVATINMSVEPKPSLRDND